MKTAFVTGISKGIGSSIKTELLNSGYKVFGVSRSNINNVRKNFTHIMADITCQKDIFNIQEKLNNCVKSLDLLILNAGGVSKYGYFEDISINDWIESINLNILANVNLIKISLPLLKKSNNSHIIFVGSAVSTNPGLSNPHYIAVKSSMLALAKNLSLVYAKDNIRVNTISPGPVLTEAMHENIKFNKPESVSLDEYSKTFLRIETSKIPLGKLINKKEIAKLIIHIDSNFAESITGQNFIIDGGKNRHL